MAEFENEITINHSIDEIFDFVTDLTNIPKWNYYVRSVMLTSECPAVQGATYHQVSKDDEQELRIVSIEHNKSFIIETVPPSIPVLRHEMIFVE